MQQRHPLSDRHQVGREVERVGTDQGDDEQHGDRHALRPELRPREGAKTLARGEGGAVADLLHGDHERKRDRNSPEHSVAERGAGLSMGRHAGRVVVRGAGDEPRSENVEETRGR